MSSTRTKIIAGILSVGLLLGCVACGRTDPEVNAPTSPVTTAPTTTTTIPENTTQPTSSAPTETQTIPILPLPEETQPIPILPLPEETQPIPILPLPEETQPTTTSPLPKKNQSPTPEPPQIEINNGSNSSPNQSSLPNLVAAPNYPMQAKCPDPADYPNDSDLYNAQQYWKHLLSLQKVDSPDNVRDLDPFMKSAMEQFLSGNGNQVCSPMNVYFALAMLAETAGGNSRQQILDLLGHSSIESLRAQAKQLWQAHYFDNGKTTSVMANSLWLDENYSFYQNTLNTLATDYFASVFKGDLGSDNMNQQLSTWLDAQTGGLLSDSTKNIQLDPATVFCLASTTYFSADWNKTFSERDTKKGVFHCDGYDLNTDFMHKTFTDYPYYYDSMYSAVSLSLGDGHTMWLILPDEGYTPTDLLKQGNYYQMISDPRNWQGKGYYKVILSVPKFDISSEQDLKSGLKAMGLTDVFNSSANFSPLTNSALNVGEISHTARVAIDEEGVIAAAYTLITAPGAAPPRETKEVHFTLDRPFLFVITGSDYLPLFSGVVSRP